MLVLATTNVIDCSISPIPTCRGSSGNIVGYVVVTKKAHKLGFCILRVTKMMCFLLVCNLFTRSKPKSKFHVNFGLGRVK